jgi:2-oxo-4-hydroxy-4-carboxy-5-ureidoimidazoline decarboxylase
MIRVDALNAMSPEEAYRQIFHSCGIGSWARAMAAARPFRDEPALWHKAEQLWEECTRSDWLEAFSHHPKIGDIESLRKKFKDTAHLAGGEQAGVQGADDRTLQALAAGNEAYEKSFGYIFIVCATGKSAAEMLALLEVRLNNDPTSELAVAAGEQKKITRLRLEKIGA